jgi:hypothetical protein
LRTTDLEKIYSQAHAGELGGRGETPGASAPGYPSRYCYELLNTIGATFKVIKESKKFMPDMNG